MRREPREKEPRALEWTLPEGRRVFLARSAGGRYSDLEQSPNLRRTTSDAETRGSPHAALEPPAWGRPGQRRDTAASTPEPRPAPDPADGHRDLAPPHRPLCRLRTDAARGVPAPPPPAQPGPTIPGRRRLRRLRRRRCSSRTHSALPRSPRSRSPAAGGGSSSLRVPAASSRQHQAHGRLCRRRPRRRPLQSRSAPHPPPRNRKWLHAAANYRPGRHRGRGPLPRRRGLARGPAAEGKWGGAGGQEGPEPGDCWPIWRRGGGSHAAVGPVTGDSRGGSLVSRRGSGEGSEAPRSVQRRRGPGRSRPIRM